MMSKKFIVKSGNGYICKMRGKKLPVMTSDRNEALCMRESQAVIAFSILSSHGFMCTIVSK